MQFSLEPKLHLCSRLNCIASQGCDGEHTVCSLHRSPQCGVYRRACTPARALHSFSQRHSTCSGQSFSLELPLAVYTTRILINFQSALYIPITTNRHKLYRLWQIFKYSSFCILRFMIQISFLSLIIRRVRQPSKRINQ